MSDEKLSLIHKNMLVLLESACIFFLDSFLHLYVAKRECVSERASVCMCVYMYLIYIASDEELALIHKYTFLFCSRVSCFFGDSFVHLCVHVCTCMCAYTIFSPDPIAHM